MSDDKPFLARWSQRKRSIAAEGARKAAEPPVANEPAAPEEPPLDLSLLPDIEALTPESDLSLFLQKGVPESLRNSALRKMWALDPAIRDYVGDALDYAWDWNAPGGVPGGGELGPGFDTAKMVALIFGDAPADENVIEDVAAQQVDVPLRSDAAAAASHQPDLVAENAAPLGISDDAPVQSSTIPAPQKRRRHGGAAPAPLDKGLMS